MNLAALIRSSQEQAKIAAAYPVALKASDKLTAKELDALLTVARSDIYRLGLISAHEFMHSHARGRIDG